MTEPLTGKLFFVFCWLRNPARTPPRAVPAQNLSGDGWEFYKSWFAFDKKGEVAGWLTA